MSHCIVTLTGLSSPVIVGECVEKSRQHQLDSVGAEFAHDQFSGVVGRGAHVLGGVAEAQQQVWQHVHDVRLEETTQLVAEHLETE